jgi:hypothetical protein
MRPWRFLAVCLRQFRRGDLSQGEAGRDTKCRHKISPRARWQAAAIRQQNVSGSQYFRPKRRKRKHQSRVKTLFNWFNSTRRGLSCVAVAVLVALFVSLFGSFAAFAGDQFKNPALAPGLPATTDPSGAIAVGKLIHPPAADPSIPLPDPNLADKQPTKPANDGPQFYGEPRMFGATERDPGVLGAQVGVRIPIPAGPSNSNANTTFSGDENGSFAGPRTR